MGAGCVVSSWVKSDLYSDSDIAFPHVLHVHRVSLSCAKASIHCIRNVVWYTNNMYSWLYTGIAISSSCLFLTLNINVRQLHIRCSKVTFTHQLSRIWRFTLILLGESMSSVKASRLNFENPDQFVTMTTGISQLESINHTMVGIWFHDHESMILFHNNKSVKHESS